MTRGDIEQYLDGQDFEEGADLQGGTCQSVLDVRKVGLLVIVLIVSITHMTHIPAQADIPTI